MNATIIWLLTAAASLSTTKYLLDHGFQYPMHLLALQIACAIVFKTVQSLFGLISRRLRNQPEHDTGRPNESHNLLGAAHSICFAGALLCSYQAMQHLSNVPAAVMILSIDWRPGTFDLRKWNPRQVGTFITLLFGVVLILIFDFRPSITGIEMSLLGAVFCAGAQVLQTRIDELRLNNTNSSEANATINFTDLFGSLFLVLLWAHWRESRIWAPGPYNPLLLHLPVLIPNALISGFCLFLKGSPFRANGLLESGSQKFTYLEDRQVARVTGPMALVCLVTISCVWTAVSPPVISVWQAVGFAVATFAILQDANDCKDKTELGNWDIDSEWQPEDDQQDYRTRTGPSHGSRRPGIGLKSFLIFLAFASTSSLGLLLDSRARSSKGMSPRPVLDQPSPAARPLDIVVARYDESASDLATHITELFSLPQIRDLSPSITIYNKNPETNTTAFLISLQSLLPNSSSATNITLHTLPNIGRETDTYLEHITSHYHNLANHTLFMQADIHFGPRAYLRQIRDYFHPSKTGFLSLAPPSSYCASCDQCFDRDWTEYPSILNALFRDFNHGRTCKNVVLTYRGQFIASAARIRGNEVGTYQRWLRELRRPQSFLHSPPYTESVWSRKEDSMSAPRVGFTLERSWGMMMQCNEKRIADRCPTMLSSVVCPTGVCGKAVLEDCQCLDE